MGDLYDRLPISTRVVSMDPPWGVIVPDLFEEDPDVAKFPAKVLDESQAQFVTDPNCDRTDHVWYQSGQEWKCCLCGAICLGQQPPDHPTPASWHPHRYDRVTEAERIMYPQNGVRH